MAIGRKRCSLLGSAKSHAIQVAAGNVLPISHQADIPLVGHAFEARIYAENPRNGFLPDGGTMSYLETPEPTCTFAFPFTAAIPSRDSVAGNAFAPNYTDATGVSPSLRLEQGFTQGDQIGVFYDPMIAKLIVHGRDRTDALRALRKALDQYRVVGFETNVPFLRTLAGDESFIEADVETGFIKVCKRIASL